MKLLARAGVMVGVVALGVWLYSAAPRDVVLVYDVTAPGAPAVLEVELFRGSERVRRAELAVSAGGGQLRHPVRLPDGDYRLRWSISGAAPARGELAVRVAEDGTLVFSLRP